MTSPRSSQPFTLERVAAETGIDRRRRSNASLADDPRRRTGLVLVDDGRQPEPSRGAHRAGDHQSRPDDRQHRPAGNRRQLDHRPMQRHGVAAVQQHDQPAGRTRLSPIRTTAAKLPACSASTRRASRMERVWPYHEILEGVLRGKIRGLWVVGTNPAHSWINQDHAHDILEPARLPGGAGHVPLHRDGPHGRSGPAGGRLGRKRRDVHQLRAAHRRVKKVRERRDRPFPISISSGSSPTIGAAARCSPAGTSPEAVFRTPQRLSARPAVRHHGNRRLCDARPPAASSGRSRRAD